MRLCYHFPALDKIVQPCLVVFKSSSLNDLTFADSEFNNKRRKTRKEIFLSRMY